VILLDTSGLLAAIDAGQRLHGPCVKVLQTCAPPFLLSPFVLAELDCLLSTKVGLAAQLALLDEVTAGVYTLEAFTRSDIARARSVVERYADLAIGLTDATLVVLAERYRVCEVLTLDERHFRTLRAFGQKRFRILPADL
jgi:predicted nucleic acid-binding protein